MPQSPVFAMILVAVAGAAIALQYEELVGACDAPAPATPETAPEPTTEPTTAPAE